MKDFCIPGIGKLLIAFSILYSIGFSANAQQKPIVKERIYQSPDGKMYVNKSLPLYLFISTDPANMDSCKRLKSQSLPQYTNPMFLDTEGLNTVRSPHAVDTNTKALVYPLQDIVFELYADSRPPVTSFSFKDFYPLKKDGKYIANKPLVLLLEGRDEISGVNQIYYSINGMDYQKYVDGIELSADSLYAVKYFATDNVGNVEDEHSIQVVIDLERPTTYHLIEGDHMGNIVAPTAKINLEAMDSYMLKEIKYSFDNKPFKTYKKSIPLRYLAQGDHVFRYIAIDEAGHSSDTGKYEFYLDNTPPVVIEELLGKTIYVNGKEYSSGRSQLKLTSFDNKAGVKEVYYSINGKDFQKYEKPFFLSTAKGNIKIETYAVDKVNNQSKGDIEQSNKVVMPYIDLTGPAIEYEFGGPVVYTPRNTYISENTTIKINATDMESGLHKIEYAIDSGNIYQYHDTIQFKDNGPHTIHVYSYDKVENTNKLHFNIYSDNLGPDISYQFSAEKVMVDTIPDTDVYPRGTVLFLSAFDNHSGFSHFTCQVNDKPLKNIESLVKDLESGNQYRLSISAFDRLGNSSTEKIKFFIE
jgi:hypothetical protein